MARKNLLTPAMMMRHGPRIEEMNSSSYQNSELNDPSGSGGVVTAIFFIGTAAGNLFAQLFNPHYLAAFSAIGMVAVLAGAANTPIAASVMAIELFGPGIAADAAVACMVSFLIVGYRSIYPSQLLGVLKSDSLVVTTGHPIGEIDHAMVSHREHSLVGFVIKIFDRFLNKNGKPDKE